MRIINFQLFICGIRVSQAVVSNPYHQKKKPQIKLNLVLFSINQYLEKVNQFFLIFFSFENEKKVTTGSPKFIYPSSDKATVISLIIII